MKIKVEANRKDVSELKKMSQYVAINDTKRQLYAIFTS